MINVSRLITITIPAQEEDAWNEALRIIRERYKLSCRAAAIRFAVYKTAGLKVRMLDGMAQKLVEVR
mgnify:CR=1 FL=1